MNRCFLALILLPIATGGAFAQAPTWGCRDDLCRASLICAHRPGAQPDTWAPGFERCGIIRSYEKTRERLREEERQRKERNQGAQIDERDISFINALAAKLNPIGVKAAETP